MEYTNEEAEVVLRQNIESTESSLKELVCSTKCRTVRMPRERNILQEEDMVLIREQLITVEVSVSRLHNYGVHMNKS